jgi:hypothetical protein
VLDTRGDVSSEEIKCCVYEESWCVDKGMIFLFENEMRSDSGVDESPMRTSRMLMHVLWWVYALMWFKLWFRMDERMIRRSLPWTT